MVECQTDEFLPEPPPEQYQPQRHLTVSLTVLEVSQAPSSEFKRWSRALNLAQDRH